jgi:ligand-binding sensor domain-containing protein
MELLETRVAPAGFQFEHSLLLNDQLSYGDYVAVSHNGELDLNDTGEFTVEAWIRRNNAVPFGLQTIVSNSIADSYWVGLSQGRLNLGIDSEISQAGPTTIPLGVWTHIAVTWKEGGQRQYFVNGNLDYAGSAGSAPGEESGPLTIGNDVSTGIFAMPMDGAISDVRLWSHVRSQEEIRRSMHVAIETPLPGLVANWHFDGRLADDIGRFDAQLVGDASLAGPAPPPQYARAAIDENFNRLTGSAGDSQPRAGAAVVQAASSNTALMLGGVIGVTATRRIDSIDTATGEVDTISLLPRAATDVSAAYSPNQERVFVFGGRNPGSGQVFDTIVEVNRRTGVASELAAVLPNALYQSAAVYHPGVDKIYVLGGRSAGLRDSVSVFDPGVRSIEPGSRLLPQSMADMSAIYSAETGDIYLFGGTNSSGESNRVYRMRVDAGDASGQTYSLTAIGFLPAAATGLSVTQDPVSKLIYLVGGHSRFSARFDHLVAFDPLTEEVWQTLLPVQRSDAGLVYDGVNRHALVVGGSLETASGQTPQSEILRIPLGDGPAVPLGRWDFPTPLPGSGNNARVTALAGDDNRVIVGTVADGAWRYDPGGGRYHYTPEMLGSTSGKVNAVHYDAANDIVYIGTDDNGVFQDDGSRQQPLFENLRVLSLEAPPAGHPLSGVPFIGTDDGLYYFSTTAFPTFWQKALPGEAITAMAHRGLGDLWVVAHSRLKNIRYNSQGNITSIVDFGDRFRGAVPTDLTIAPNGEFWATVADVEFGAGVYRLLVGGNGNPVGDAQFIEPDAAEVGNLASGIDVDSDGRLWVSMNSGFGMSGGLAAFEIDEDADELRGNDPINWLSGPVGEANTDFTRQFWTSNLQDVAGVDERVWTGRFDGKLITYAQRWSQIDESNDLKDKVIREVWTARGRLFAAGSDALYVLNPDGRTWDNREDLSVRDVFADSRGNIWVGADDGPRLYQGSGWDMLADRAGERPNQRVSAIAEDKHGRIWLGGNDGLTLFDRNRFVATFTPDNSPLPAAQVGSLFVDRENRLWIGTNLGLAIFENDHQWKTLTQANGLPSNLIHEVVQLPDGQVAVSTKGALSYVSSSFIIPRDDTFPLDATSLKLAVDELGRLWANNAVRTPDGWQVYYDTNSGLRSPEISDVAVDQAGRVWFSHAPDAGLSVRGAYLPPLGNVFPEFDAVTPISPAEGSNGQIIEIRGKGFGDNLNDIAVTIGGSEVEVVEVSNRTIRVRIGPNTTSGDVSVSRAGRRVTIDDAFQAIPVITGVTPTGGNAGVVVEIMGTNMDSGATVALDGIHFRGPMSGTPTLLTTTILPGDGTGNVTVRNPSGREDIWTTRTFRAIDLTIDRLVLNQGILGYDLVDGKPTFVQHYLAHSIAPRTTDAIQVDRVVTTFTGPGGAWTAGPYVQRLFQPDAQRPSHAIAPSPVVFETVDESVNAVLEPHFPEAFVGGNVTVTAELYRNDQLVAPAVVQVTPFQNDRPLRVLLVPIMRRGYSNTELADLRTDTDTTLTELRNRVWPLGDVETFWSTTHVFEIPDLIDDPLDTDGRIDIGDRIDFFDASHELDEARRWFNDHSNTYADSVYGVVQNDPRVIRDNTAEGMAVTPDFELLNDLLLTEVDRLCDIAAVGLSFLSFGFFGDTEGCSLELPQRVAWGLHDADVGTYAQEIGHNFGLVARGAPNHNDNPFSSDFNLAHSDVDELRGGFCGDDGVQFDARLTLYQRQPGIFGPIVNPLSNPEVVNGLLLPQGQQFVADFAAGPNGNRAKSVMSYACNTASANVFFEPVDARFLQTAFGIRRVGGSAGARRGNGVPFGRITHSGGSGRRRTGGGAASPRIGRD